VAPAALEEEIERLRHALRAATQEAHKTRKLISEKVGPKFGDIFGAHSMIIEDPAFEAKLSDLIHQHGFTAEYAVSRLIREHAKKLEAFGAAAKSIDLHDIEKSILSNLLGYRCEQLNQLKEAVIVLAHDLTPSETAALDRTKVHAFATEAGGRTSHTAIVAAGLEIPAVVGLGKFVHDVSGGDVVIVDGNQGVLIVDPDPETIERYERTRRNFHSFETRLEELRDLPAETRDGSCISLLGNIEFPHEAKQCLSRGADGIGLYRTEFLYLNRQTDPTEEEHLDAYLTVIKTLGPDKPVVIRTLDLGADKFATNPEADANDRNPFLGLRSVRYCLRNLTLFKTQMRAILRASAAGNVRIMFPMVSTILELRQCKMILAEVKEDLEEEGIAFNRQMPIGTMIEVPSAAIMADQLAREVDFFSIGTNDLIQYTLAADRTNELVASLYSPADPAVLRLIHMVVAAARHQAIEVNVCGEMSGEPIYSLLLLGMGLKQLSVTPHNIPEVKKIIRSVTVAEAARVAEEALRLETARGVTNFLREHTRRILPEVVG
jgi:phosphotransferase system enzyme I (PtsI)